MKLGSPTAFFCLSCSIYLLLSYSFISSVVIITFFHLSFNISHLTLNTLMKSQRVYDSNFQVLSRKYSIKFKINYPPIILKFSKRSFTSIKTLSKLEISLFFLNLIYKSKFNVTICINDAMKIQHVFILNIQKWRRQKKFLMSSAFY